ncbi:thioester domain-containing protein [Spirillospora sp. NPDC049652]
MLLFLSVCVSPAVAEVDPGRFPASVVIGLPPEADFDLTDLGGGTGLAGYLGPETLDPQDGYPAAGYDKSGFVRHDVGYAGIINGVGRDGTPLRTYCIDLAHEAWGGMAYRYASWSEENVPNLGYIARILHDYYPNTDEPAGLSTPLKAAVVQAAIWFFSDRYVLAEAPPVFEATSAIVSRVLAEGPLPPPRAPELRISGPDSIRAGDVSGPFTVHTTAESATVSIAGGRMFEDAAGTRPIPSGARLRDGESFYVSSDEPGSLRISAHATAVHPAGEVALYVRDPEGQPGFPEQGQKIILAADAETNVEAEKTVEVTETPPEPPKPPKHRPSLKIRKWVHPHSYHRAGQVLRFTYKVTNTGRVPLDRVQVDDRKRGLSQVRCPHTSLWPGQSMVCTATYRVTKKDLWKRSVKNCAVANGRDPEHGTPVRSRRACAQAYGHIAVTG